MVCYTVIANSGAMTLVLCALNHANCSAGGLVQLEKKRPSCRVPVVAARIVLLIIKKINNSL